MKLRHKAYVGATAVFSGLLTAVSASAQLKTIDTGLEDTGKAAGFETQGADLSGLIGKIIGSLLGFLGVVFVVLMIYAGFLYMTAQGNEDQVTKAKDLIKNAVIGMVIISLAYAITTFVIGSIG